MSTSIHLRPSFETNPLPAADCCAACDYYLPCQEEACSNEEPHGMCYVHPPRLLRGEVDDEGAETHASERGIPTWAAHPACRFHPRRR